MINLVRIGVGPHVNALAPVHLAKIGIRHVDAQPEMVQVGQSNDGRAGGDHFAQLRLPHQYHSVEGSAQRGVRQPDARQMKALVRLMNVGLIHLEFLFPRALPQLVVDLLRPVVGSLRAGHAGGCLIAGLRGYFVFLGQRLVARVILFSLLEVGLGVEDGLPGRFNLLVAAARQAEGELAIPHAGRGFVDHQLLAIIVIVLIDRQGDDAASHFEAHQAFVGFDVARELQQI